MAKWIAAAAAALLAGAAGATDVQGFSGAKEIARGDLSAAERAILDQQRMFPRDADLLLNLAYVYARTGRQAEARALYQRVANAPDELLDMADARRVKAHKVAAAGLRSLEPRVASR